MLAFQMGRYCQTQLAGRFDAMKGFNVGIGYVDGRAATTGARDEVAAQAAVNIDGNRTDATQKFWTEPVNYPAEFIFTGIAPEGVCGFLFDSDPEPRTWLDLAVEKQVKLEMKTRMYVSPAPDDYSDGYIRILLDRLMPHKKTA